MAEEFRPNILFMGAGAFSVPILQALMRSQKLRLLHAVSQPDRAAGRKRVLTPSPLARFADEAGFPCLRVPSVNTPEFLDHAKALAPDLIVVVSFGQILREPILNLPPFGCLNVHASILPKYRGASPIAAALLNGDMETGVTFMLMEKGLDSGPILEIHRTPIGPGVPVDVLERNLALLAADRLESCILRLISGEARPRPQPSSGISVAAKIRKSDGLVDWREDAALLERKVRAYRNWPSMAFRIALKARTISVKITQASQTSFGSAEPGKIIAISKEDIMVACGRGSLLLRRIIPEGKKEMSVSDFLNGTNLAVGDVLLNGA